MATIVQMPKLGLSMQEGIIIKWHKSEGDAVNKGEPLFDLETDKLTNTANATESGTLLKILAAENTTVPILSPVAIIGMPGEESLPTENSDGPSSLSSSEAPLKLRIISSPRARVVAKELCVDLNKVSGTGPNGRIIEKDVRACAEFSSPRTPSVKVSPLAAKITADLGVDPSKIKDHGRVLAQDILNYLQNASTTPMAEQFTEVVPMNGMRKNYR